MSQVIMEGLDLSMDELMGHMMAFAMKETFAPAEPAVQAFTPPMPGADTTRPHVETDGSFYGSLGLFAQNLQQVQFMLRFFDEWVREESERTAGVEYGTRRRLDRMEETIRTLNERVESLSGQATAMEMRMIREFEEVRRTQEAQQATLEAQQAVLEAQQATLETQRLALETQQKQLDEQPQIFPFQPNGNGHAHVNGHSNGNGNGHGEGNGSGNGADKEQKNKWVLLPISSLWKK